MAEDFNKKIQARELLIGVFFSLFLTVILIRAVHLHVINSNKLATKAKSQYTSYKISSGKRGTIYDVNHNKMAVSIDTISIGAFPRKITDKKTVAKKLAKALGMKTRHIEKKLNTSRSFVWIKRKIPPKAVSSVKRLKLKGLEYISEHSRAYPNKSLAAQLIGFTGTDENGLEGLEYRYDKELSGSSNKVVIMKDALGRGFHVTESHMNGFEGNDLTLTIDKRIQFIAETAVKETTEKYDANFGTAVVMNPNTGAILAIAQYPEFNPNTYNKYGQKIWKNRAVTDSFEPGSTLKIFPVAAAIESGLSTPSSIFFCENGSYQIGKNKIKDTHPKEWLSIQQIIKFSSNIGIVKVSETIGKEALYKTLKNFGFGQKTDIDYPGETKGILSHYSRWSEIDTGAISFGQGVSVSAVQLLSAMSVIANGGVYVKPHIVSMITTPSGEIISEFNKPKEKRIISKTTTDKLKNILATVVTKGGTGVNAGLKKYTVCGKTGTAQKSSKKGGYSKDKYVSSFVGFAPRKNPEVAVLVVLDEPTVNHYGGTVAAPAFRTIVHNTLNYLNVEPEVHDNSGNILVAQRSKRKKIESF